MTNRLAHVASIYKAFMSLSILTMALPAAIFAADLPALDASFETAKAYTKGQELIVSTGKVERRWKWTGKGMATVTVSDASGKVFASGGSASDWHVTPADQEGRIVSLKAFRDNDEKFTSDHLAVEAEVDYGNLQLKYVVWAYPGAPGLRTQLWLKSTDKVASLGDRISEELNVATTPVSVTSWGYEAGLKADSKTYEVLHTEELKSKAESSKTSGLMVDLKDHGLILVKESHAHMKIGNTATDIGAFHREGRMLRVSGLGMIPKNVSSAYKFCWANWMILYQGGEVDGQMALKRFDRFRFPVHPERDVFIMANTWGSEDMSSQCKYKAREENVLREIEACKNLGVDLLQIDDGWQDGNWLPKPVGSPKKGKKIQQNTTDEVSGHHKLLNGKTIPATYDVYPNGFGKVRDAAKAAGIRLGLWHAWTAPIESITTNMENGDFKSFKLDFAHLANKSALDRLYYKGRSIVKDSKYTAVVNWDVTETSPRMGFYFGRDCGNLYLENRKAATVRPGVLYDPWHILRDAWMLAQYTNLNKIQLTYQDKDKVPAAAQTNAREYPHDYNMAITLMSSPILFLETQLLSEEAVGILKPMIANYKAEREAMYEGYVFSLGAMPDNKSWTGLQNYNPQTGKGYLMVFRELKNRESEATIKLHFLKPGATLSLTNVMTGETRKATLTEKAELDFEIPQAPGFLFLKYE